MKFLPLAVTALVTTGALWMTLAAPAQSLGL
jgi:hypothetical protein